MLEMVVDCSASVVEHTAVEVQLEGYASSKYRNHRSRSLLGTGLLQRQDAHRHRTHLQPKKAAQCRYCYRSSQAQKVALMDWPLKQMEEVSADIQSERREAPVEMEDMLPD